MTVMVYSVVNDGHWRAICGNGVVLAAFRHENQVEAAVRTRTAHNLQLDTYARSWGSSLIASDSYPNYVIYSSLYMYTVFHPETNAR